ncbi:hypothetical protein EON63_20885, partial [archaeon]
MCSALASWLSSGACPRITSLLLDDQELGDEGITALCGALASLPHLSRLSLNACDVQGKHAMRVARYEWLWDVYEMIHSLPYFVVRIIYLIHTPYTIYHTPYTIYHIPYTIHHIPYTIHHIPYTI